MFVISIVLPVYLIIGPFHYYSANDLGFLIGPGLLVLIFSHGYISPVRFND